MASSNLMSAQFGEVVAEAVKDGLERYILMPWAFMRAARSAKLGMEERDVLLALLDEVRGSPHVRVAQSQLAAKTGIERHNVQRAITKLARKRGFIKLGERRHRHTQDYDLSPFIMAMNAFLTPEPVPPVAAEAEVSNELLR